MKTIGHHLVARPELRGFLGVLFVLTCTNAPADQTLSADWVETLLTADQTQRNYRGRIAYTDSLRNVSVNADSAHVRVEDAIYHFVFQVSYKDTAREIRADTLVYEDRNGRATFRGRVFFRDDQRELGARMVRFLREEEILLAEGDVALQLPEDRRLTASTLRYELRREQGHLQGHTRARVIGGDTLEARADSIAFAKRGAELAFHGNLSLQQGDMRGTALSGAYADSAIVLYGNPAMRWTDAEQRDSIFARGTEMRLELADQTIGALALFDSTRISAFADSAARSQTIQADSARIVFHDDAPQRVHAWGKVQLDLHAQERAALSGSDLRLAYRDGKADSLILSGGCTGSYVARDSSSKSRLGGKRCVLWFSEGALSQMALFDEAHCTRIAQDSDHVTVSGDELLLHFEAGHLSSVRADGAVRGHYIRMPEESNPEGAP